MRGRRPVDDEAQELRKTVVATRIHQGLSPVDEREVEIRDDHALS
jgi:hypothetical protein